LAQRLLTFVAKHCDGEVPVPGEFTPDDTALLAAAADALRESRDLVEQQNIKGMTAVIINVAKLGNKYIDTQAPWTLRKTDEARMRTVMYVLAEVIRVTAVLLSPVMSVSCNNMLDQIGKPLTIQNFKYYTSHFSIICGLVFFLILNNIGQLILSSKSIKKKIFINFY
jgi:methionyl-tRNA synthetase